MTDTLTIENHQAAQPTAERGRPAWRTIAVTSVATVSVAAAGLWLTKPSTTEACGTAIGISYKPAPTAHQEVVPAIAGGRPRWVCRTTFADGATSQSWTGR